MQVREHGADQWPEVRALIDRAFAPDLAAGLLTEWVRGHGLALSLVAVADGELAGHVLFGRLPLRCDDDTVDVLCLSPLSVDPAARGRGIARALVEHGLAALRQRPEPVVVLEGDPALYSRFGFRPAAEFGIERPSELVPEPAFQAVALPSYRAGLRGRVEYPQYFFDIGAVGP
jgi:putative acetyltransferase